MFMLQLLAPVAHQQLQGCALPIAVLAVEEAVNEAGGAAHSLPAALATAAHARYACCLNIDAYYRNNEHQSDACARCPRPCYTDGDCCCCWLSYRAGYPRGVSLCSSPLVRILPDSKVFLFVKLADGCSFDDLPHDPVGRELSGDEALAF